MKKVYITPVMRSHFVNGSALIAANLSKASEGTSSLTPEGDGYVYGDAKRGNYNVWEEDWSK